MLRLDGYYVYRASASLLGGLTNCQGSRMATSNAASISLPPSAIKQFKSLLSNIDRLPDILERSKGNEPGVTLFQILRVVAGSSSIDYDVLAETIYALENLRHLEAEFGTPGEAFSRVIAAVDRDLAKQLEEKKDNILGAVKIYKDDHPIYISYKAQRLAYLHERIYRDAEIITDVRPVFDSTGEKVLEAVISHTLVVNFGTLGRSERSHFAMDAGDVLKLRKACDRAISKAKSLQSAFAGSRLDWKIHILRGEDDGTS